MNLNATKSNTISKFNLRDLIIFILPVLLFSLYLMVYNPGVLTVASYSQLHQIVTGQFTNAHPMFHTLFEIIVLKIFKSLFYISLFQILIFSAIWMIICKYHRNDDAESINNFFLQFIVTLIISIIPINAVYSITLSSNILFSYSLMFLCFLIKVMIDKNGMISNKLIILMVLTLAIMSGLSNYGIYVALLSLFVIVLYLYKKGSSKNTMSLIAGSAVICILLIASLNFIYGIESDNLDIPTNDAFEDDINLENSRNHFFSYINEEPTDSIENVTSLNYKNNKYNFIDSFVNLWKENFILDGLFDNPILCMIFSIILFGLIFGMTKSKEIFIIYVPNLFNIIMVVLTGQNNLYSNLLTFYLIIIVLISLWFKKDLKLEDISKMPSAISKHDIEPQRIAQENYYSNLENEIEKLTLDEINEMMGDTSVENQQPTPEGESDLIDEILKEIERDKK